MKKNILITGHKGMVGSAIVERFKEDSNYNIILFHGDLREKEELEVMFDYIKPKIHEVICCAGRVGGIISNSKYPYQYLYDNAMIGMNTINVSYERNVDKLIYLGSSCIYPRTDDRLIYEEDLLTNKLEKSNEGYALAKITCVKLVQYLNNEYGKNYYSLMPCNLFGKNDNYNPTTSHVIPALIQKIHLAKENNVKEMEMLGSPSTLREFMYTDDLAELSYQFMQHINAEDIGKLTKGLNWVNIGSGSDVELKTIAEMIKEAIKYEGKFKWNDKLVGVNRKLMYVSVMLELLHDKGIRFQFHSLAGSIINTYKDFLERLMNGDLRK
jgi:GDP-L-fucose synthase